MTQPLVSIVTPSFDQAPFLEETIRSVLSQDYEPIEYVVVDGGSTDGSVDIIRRYENRLAWWISELDRGQAHALNKGFARAQGKYVGWLCSDDTLFPSAISRLVEALEDAPDAALAYGNARYTDGSSTLHDDALSGPWDPARMVRTAQVPNQQPATLYTRCAYEAAGPLDEDAWYYLDYQLTVRLAGIGRGVHVPETLATYRIHAGGKSTGQPGPKAADAIRCADQFMTSALVPSELRPYAREGRATFYRRAGDLYSQAGQLWRARRYYARAGLLAPRVLTRRSIRNALPPRLAGRLTAWRTRRL
jgi:glycosyltransferase involved in cell wall biosynthesis